MQIEEIYQLTTWINQQVVEPNIVKKYSTLHKVINQNAQPNQQKSSFEEQKNDLISALSKISFGNLTTGQIGILEKMGIASRVGKAGIDLLEDILYKNSLDVANAAQKINESTQSISQGIAWSNETRAALSKIIDAEEVLEIKDSVLLRVHFTNNAKLSNLTEFKDWGKTWYEIGRGIAMAHGKAPEDISVIGASKGSVIISLLTIYGIAKTVSGILLEALKVSEKCLDIKKKAEEIKALQLSNDKAEHALLAEAEKVKTDGIKTIVESNVTILNINRTSEGDKVTALESSIKKLVDFAEKGGEIDFVMSDDQSNGTADSDKEQIKQLVNQIRVIDEKIKAIEHKKP